METLPALERLADQAKDARIVALWAEVQRLQPRLAEREATRQDPVKDARHARGPPSHTRQATPPTRPPQGTPREASVGRAGGGRPLHPAPDQVSIANAKGCPHGGERGSEAGPSLQTVYNTSERPPVKPIVTRVEPYGGRGAGCGQPSVAPVPAGREAGPPFGASVQRRATSLRSTHASRYERLAALVSQVSGLDLRAGGLAHVCQRVNGRLDHRVTAIRTRWRSRRLSCSDDTSARVNGQQQWEGVVQTAEGCLHGIRPSRGQGVLHDVLGTPRPTIWGAALDSAPQHHPAEDWQVCLAHHVRACQLAIDAGAALCAPRLKAMFLRALALHTRRDSLAASTRSQYRGALQRRVHRGRALQPTNSHGRRVQKRDAKIPDHWCRFREDGRIPPTHNSSDQAIRRSTVFRKGTTGFRSAWGRALCAAVRAVVNTGKRQGLSAFQSMQSALSPVGSLFNPGGAITFKDPSKEYRTQCMVEL
jgi:transposase